MVDKLSIEDLEGVIQESVEADEFSGAVLVARDSKPIFRKAYGLANKRFNIPNRVDTKFNIGSLNKIFTRVAVTQLAERGELSFNDLVGKHLPDYPAEAAGKVTIHHLLTHRSGMGHYWNEVFEASKGDLRTVDDFIRLFVDDPLSFEPGTRYQYSNAGYVVLGKIVEVASGQDYYDYVRENIYKPAGINDSDHYELDAPVPNLATGYTRMGPDGRPRPGPRRSNCFIIGVKGSPAGGGYSTVEDLLRFDIALNERRLLGPECSDTVLKIRRKIGDVRIIAHAGGAPGICALFEKYLGTGYTVIILSNYDPLDGKKIRDELRDVILKNVYANSDKTRK